MLGGNHVLTNRLRYGPPLATTGGCHRCECGVTIWEGGDSAGGGAAGHKEQLGFSRGSFPHICNVLQLRGEHHRGECRQNEANLQHFVCRFELWCITRGWGIYMHWPLTNFSMMTLSFCVLLTCSHWNVCSGPLHYVSQHWNKDNNTHDKHKIMYCRKP